MKFGVPAGVSIYCMACEKKVEPTLENGETIYPNRKDLYEKTFLRCPTCLNYVGAEPLRKNDTLKSWHKRLEQRAIPTPQARAMRRRIHSLTDDLWKNGRMKRGYIYQRLSKATGGAYHNATVCDYATMEKAYQEALRLRREAENMSGFTRKRYL